MKTATKINNGEYYDHSTGRVVSRPGAAKFATMYADQPLMVRLPDGTSLNYIQAREKGFTVNRVPGRAPKASPPARMTDAGLESEAARYLAAIRALPEAQERPETAQKIGEAYNFKVLPVARAAAILRGLPSEIDEMRERLEAKRIEREAAVEDPRIKRKVELRIAGLSLLASFDDAARKERTALTMGLTIARESKISVRSALARVKVDARPFL